MGYQDLAGKVAAELKEIRTIFGIGDESFRRLRTLLLQGPSGLKSLPVEWIPTSEH